MKLLRGIGSGWCGLLSFAARLILRPFIEAIAKAIAEALESANHSRQEKGK